MKVIIHIGTEKTGTTSIQSLLKKNFNTLKEHGYHPLQCGGPRNNRLLVSYCMSENNGDAFFRKRNITTPEDIAAYFDNLLSEFAAEMESLPKDTKAVIISAEHFHSRTNSIAEIEKLKKLLDAYFQEFEVICYVREQLSTCVSLYSTLIKGGGKQPINKALEQCTPDNLYYNYFSMLENWEAVFGINAMNVSVFERDKLLNQDLLDDFVGKFCPDLIGSFSRKFKDKNESLTYPGQILGRALNSVFPNTAEIQLSEIQNCASNQCRTIVNSNFSGKGQYPETEDQDRIRNSFMESNEKLKQKYFPDSDSLFNLSPMPMTDKTIDESFYNSIVDIFTILNESKSASVLPDKYADIFRDAAIKIEKDDITLAYELMKLASIVRPSGNLIKKKLQKYEKKQAK